MLARTGVSAHLSLAAQLRVNCITARTTIDRPSVNADPRGRRVRRLLGPQGVADDSDSDNCEHSRSGAAGHTRPDPKEPVVVGSQAA